MKSKSKSLPYIKTKRSSRDTIGSVTDLHEVDLNTLLDDIDCSDMENTKKQILQLISKIQNTKFYIRGLDESVLQLKNKCIKLNNLRKYGIFKIPKEHQHEWVENVTRDITYYRSLFKETDKISKKEKEEFKKLRLLLKEKQDNLELCIARTKLKLLNSFSKKILKKLM